MTESIKLACIALAEKFGPFDLLLVADGSGTVVDKPCGWCCISWDRANDRLELFRGASSHGTNNYAELYPFVHALWAHHAKRNAPPLLVGLVSDSELTVKCGKREYQRSCNLALWAAMDHLESVGFKFSWHHVPRNSNPVNTECDRLSKAARNLMMGARDEFGEFSGGSRKMFVCRATSSQDGSVSAHSEEKEEALPR